MPGYDINPDGFGIPRPAIATPILNRHPVFSLLGRGPRGEKGDTGATGPQGAKGDKGDKGDPGEGGGSLVHASDVYTVASGDLPMTDVPIPISDFEPGGDVLLVSVDGSMLVEGVDFHRGITGPDDTPCITLATPISHANAEVGFYSIGMRA